MMASKVRVAVIGCGAQGQNHLRAYRRDPAVDVVAICDTDQVRLAEASRTFQVPRQFQDYRDLLDSGTFDLVSICAMPNSHYDMTVAALGSGANVLCEKPMALNADEASGMVEAALRANRFLTIGFNMRFMPSAQYLKCVVGEGRLGKPVYTRAWTFATDIPWWGRHYVKRISGGGVLASTAVHLLDLALWVGNHPRPVSVSASATRLFPRKQGQSAPDSEAAEAFDVEDTFSGHIRFEDGSWMTLEGCWASDRPAYSYSFEMIGELATAQFAPLLITGEQDGSLLDLAPAGPLQETGMEGWEQSIQDEIADVVAAVREGRQPLVQAQEALTVQAIVDALYKSAESQREVEVIRPMSVR